MARWTLISCFLSVASAFTPSAPATFATFGNDHSKALLKMWQPKPVGQPSGSVLLPSSQENMKRYVRARILLEDASTGCVAVSVDESTAVCVCRFNKAEHQLLLPLWPATIEDESASKHIFRELLKWHQERFGESHQGTRLSGALLEIPEDKAAWRAACDEGI